MADGHEQRTKASFNAEAAVAEAKGIKVLLYSDEEDAKVGEYHTKPYDERVAEANAFIGNAAEVLQAHLESGMAHVAQNTRGTIGEIIVAMRSQDPTLPARVVFILRSETGDTNPFNGLRLTAVTHHQGKGRLVSLDARTLGTSNHARFDHRLHGRQAGDGFSTEPTFYGTVVAKFNGGHIRPSHHHGYASLNDEVTTETAMLIADIIHNGEVDSALTEAYAQTASERIAHLQPAA